MPHDIPLPKDEPKRYLSTSCDDTTLDQTQVCEFVYVDRTKSEPRVAQLITCAKDPNAGPSFDDQWDMYSIAARAIGSTTNLDVPVHRCRPIEDANAQDDGAVWKDKFSSSCGPSFNARDVTNVVRYTCEYTGSPFPGMDRRSVSGSIAACASEHGDRQLLRDVKTSAAKTMGREFYGSMSHSDIHCKYYGAPY